MENIFNELGYKATRSKSSMLSEEKEFFYIANSDGSIRCLWPATVKHPLLFEFNTTDLILSKQYGFFLKLMIKLKIQSKVLGKISLYVIKNNKNSEFDINGNWTIFNQPQGQNNKAIVFTQNGEKLNFIKLILN